MNQPTTILYGVENCSMRSRAKIQEVCDSLGIETYKVTDAKAVKLFPDLILTAKSVVENINSKYVGENNEFEAVTFVSAQEFINTLEEKFKK